MTQIIKTSVRSISYGDDFRNCVGLNPLSGALLDHTPRQRELWALRRSESQFEAHSAVYLGTHFEIETVGAHRAPEPVPAHEDIFATDVFDAIVDDDDILIDVDPVFVGASHRAMQD